ncbi:MAG: peptidoglycan editing factor PgeF [Thermodesulfovibrionales bacterium]|nr:peptidoglycan editing factor PgeF [Thermodesulfovibrionales bacterium]
MIEKEDINKFFIYPPIFTGLPIKAFFTTKALNGNLKIISRSMGVPISRIYKPIQKHTDKVIIYESKGYPKIGDAVITDRQNVLIGIDVADCVPILIYDKRRDIVGAVHAGWRGTAQQILKKTIKRMEEAYSSYSTDILIAIGPAIKDCCYEVGYEVIKAIIDSTGLGEYCIQKKDRYYLDLQKANLYQAISVGIPSDNIWILKDCTCCQPDRFFSYRYSKGKTGSQSGYIGIFYR